MEKTWTSVLFIKLNLILQISNDAFFWHTVSLVKHFPILVLFLYYPDFISLLSIPITTLVEGFGY